MRIFATLVVTLFILTVTSGALERKALTVSVLSDTETPRRDRKEEFVFKGAAQN